ncbi:MAG: hypothetical protein JW931_02525 [Methanomicrobiaceae archaeon]|nr:hypothetical protein [Methanomicrobiaceae archaeon]
MQISGRIVSNYPNAEFVAESLSADNLLSMKTKAKGNDVICEIHGEKLRSVIASVDDYLMNLSVAEDICSIGHNAGDSIEITGKYEKQEVN